LATKLYLSGASPPLTPADATFFSTGQAWDIPTVTPPAALKLARTGNWPASTAFTAITSDAETSATNARDVAIRRFVSDPLVGAQTITGTLKGQAQMMESAGGMNALPTIQAKVISNDGSTLVGTLYGGDSRTTTVDELNLSLTNGRIPASGVSPVTLSSVSASDGNRILIEVGARANNTVTTSFTAQLRVGNTTTPGGANDLGEGTFETASGLNAWVEFSQNLNFDAAETIPMDAAALASLGRTAAVTPGAISRLMDPATLASAGRTLSVIRGAVTLALDAANIAAQGRNLTILSLGDAQIVLMDAAALVAQGRASSTTVGAASLLMDAAVLAAEGRDATVSVPELITMAAGSDLEAFLLVGSHIEATALTGTNISAETPLGIDISWFPLGYDITPN
jgi:hypothetical protein